MRALHAPPCQVRLSVGTSCKNKKKRNPINKCSDPDYNAVATSTNAAGSLSYPL